jgi:hypothetical protein
MVKLEDILKPVSVRHQNALKWFRERAGTRQPWPQPLKDGTLLASKAKGIYKPDWSKYALSIRQNIASPYEDQEPLFRKDGTWSYAYFQENRDPMARDSEYTNRGLIACWKDKVPVGVMRQVSTTPNVRYAILGLALVSGWENGYFYLEGFSSEGVSEETHAEVNIDLATSAQEEAEINSGAFDPTGLVDGRKRILASIVQRRGQPQFRHRLMSLYMGRCAITGCNVEETLEAAHILPYLGPDTNHPSNGLLLRSDLHVLFDIGLIAIDTNNWKVLISSKIKNSSYSELEGKVIRLPKDKSALPSSSALNWHRQWTGL